MVTFRDETLNSAENVGNSGGGKYFGGNDFSYKIWR